MPAAQPRPESAVSATPAVPPGAAPGARPAPASASAAARLADELAVPAPSPVHQLQAELAQLTAPPDPDAEQLYPGWFRLAFPLVSSALLWAAILWGASHLL
ncbi:hypothetical protein [Novosphingobium sp.]|uniref:hypothetical protein n=1 Tax=Novosphingobium sp. TaxID=1874826 RepID=UPI003BAC13CF